MIFVLKRTRNIFFTIPPHIIQLGWIFSNTLKIVEVVTFAHLSRGFLDVFLRTLFVHGLLLRLWNNETNLTIFGTGKPEIFNSRCPGGRLLWFHRRQLIWKWYLWTQPRCWLSSNGCWLAGCHRREFGQGCRFDDAGECIWLNFLDDSFEITWSKWAIFGS